MTAERDPLRDKAAIVGIGQTRFGKQPEATELGLALEAILDAVADAGFDVAQVDGLIRFGASQTGCSEVWVAHNLGLPNLRHWGSVDYGGSASAALAAHAAAAVVTGLADYVVCYRSLTGSSGRRPGTSDTYALMRGADPGYDNYLMPYGLTAPIQKFALLARRHMHEYGTTPEHLARVSVAVRDYACRNPAAQMHGRPLTVDDCFAAPMISSPLRRYDCCPHTDGAVAFVVTTAERARDLRSRPVYIKAATQATVPEQQGPLHSFLARGTGILDTPARAAGKEIYRRSGFRPDDIDVAQLYDCFTITLLVQLEAYGFCGPGESGPFVADGGISPDGKIPVNTAGGNLSEGYLHGVNHILEGVRQMRATSTSQVPDAQLCLVAGANPVPTSAVLLGREVG